MVGAPDPLRREEVDAAIDRFKADPNEQTYEAVFTAMEATIVSLQAEDCWYAFRNMGRGKYYMKNISSKLTSSSSLISSGAGQHFRFICADGNGRYYIQCAKDMSYLVPTGSDSQQLTLVAEKVDAGIYSISSNLRGQSFIVCQNPTGSHAFLSLSENRDKVLPASPTDASRWFIEVTAFIPANVDEVVVEIDEKRDMFDLSGRRVAPGERGIYIVGNKKKLIK